MAQRNLTITLVCPVCQRDFHPWKGREDGARFCSILCQARSDLMMRTKTARKIERPARECPHCHRSFIPRRTEQRFCSPSCARGHSLASVSPGASHSSTANEKRRQALLRRASEGRPLRAKRSRAIILPVIPTAEPNLEADAPPLPPLIEDETIPQDDEGTLDTPAPLTLPLQGAAARNEWLAIGELREMQADKLLRQEELHTTEGRTIILAGQGSYLGVESGALVCHQGRTHGVPAPERELLWPALHGVRRILWIGGHGYVSGTMTLAAASWCQRENMRAFRNPVLRC